MYITWKIVIDLHVYAWVQIHRIVNIKRVFFTYQWYFYKDVKNNKWVTFYEKYFYDQIIKYFHMELSYLDWFSTVVFQKKYAVVYNYIFLAMPLS